MIVVGDSLTVVLVISWLHSALFGGARFDWDFLTFSNRDSSRALALAALAVLLRHATVRRPTLLTVAGTVLACAAKEPGQSVRPWRLDTLSPMLVTGVALLVTRTAVVVSGLIATTSVGPSGNPILDQALERSRRAPLEYLQSRWDAGWYASIAIDGYKWDPTRPSVQQNVAFFPAFPLVVRAALWPADALTRALGIETTLGRDAETRAVNLAALLSVVFFSAALAIVGRIAERDIGRSLANRAIVITAAAPFSVFFSAPYTESLYLLTMAGAFLGLQRGRPGWSFASGMVLGLTRQTGFLVTVPLALYAFSLCRDKAAGPWLRPSYVLALSAPCIGAALYCLYLWWSFGDPFAWVHAQSSWGKVERWRFLIEAQSVVEFVSLHPYEAINLAAALIAIPLIWKSRRLSGAYVALGLIAVTVPLIAGVAPLARMTAPLFPVYIVLAAIVTRRSAFVVVSCVLFALQIIAAWHFYGWRGLY